MKKIWSIFLIICCGFTFAQEAHMEMEAQGIRIGEQVVVNITFDYPNPTGDALVIWPDHGKTITKKVEIIDATIDREQLIDSATSMYRREQKLRITSFDAGTYTIPAQKIILNDSVYKTETRKLDVATVEVDTSQSIYDIRPIYEVNYPFSERAKDWLSENWMILVGVGLAVLIFFVWRYIKNRPSKGDAEEELEEEIIPAHITALERLQVLLQDESWKNEEKKTYYSNLTDTVRTYLEQRFAIHAMEQTTREIITNLKFADISEDDKLYLRRILSKADMVKFAKSTATDENAFEALERSIEFVKRTKEETE